MAKTIAVAIHKGGVGKTTTSKNLAASLALLGYRTLLVDVDEQANATKGLGVDPAALEVSLNDLFTDPQRDPASVIVTTELDLLHLMPAHGNLAQSEKGMALQRADPNAPDPRTTLRDILTPLEAVYDFIIIDTPPAINYMTTNALAAADMVLIPAAASAYTEDGLSRTWQAYERARSDYNASLAPPRILVTRVKRTNASKEVFAGVQRDYLTAVIDQLIPESTIVDEAEQLQRPVVLYDPDSAAAQAYKRVAEILANEQ